MILFLTMLYVVCAGFTVGAIGGVRDEMDGIGDLLKIIFWPIFWCWLIIVKTWKIVYKLGQQFVG